MVITFMISNNLKACVDYHPTPPPITVKIDSNWSYFEITVHQLNIFAGSTGQFCTCALSAYSNLFSSIYYVAFVDSGTTNPINGFAVWNANANSTTAWSGVMAGNTWNGFVANIVTNMSPGLPVELIIKAQLPPGYTSFFSVDSVIVLSSLGTDEWNNTSNTLANTHNSISGFGTSSYFLVSPSYFTGIADMKNSFTINIFPNPFSAQTTLYTANPLNNATLTVDNCFGQTVAQIKNISGQTITFNQDNLPSGLYFVRLTVSS